MFEFSSFVNDLNMDMKRNLRDINALFFTFSFSYYYLEYTGKYHENIRKKTT